MSMSTVPPAETATTEQIADTGLLDRSFICRDMGNKTSRTIRNWQDAGILPPPDCVFQGLPYWTRATYNSWKSRVLRGEFAGIARINNVRNRATAT
jgi:hypothetical protein